MAYPKLIVTGYGRHGKDTLCDMLSPMNFVSSSMFVCEKAVYPHLQPLYNYRSLDQCYADRHQHRQEWYDLISAYNEPDAAKLTRELLSEYDIYCGLRSCREFYAARQEGLFDLSIWVDASGRLPPEPSESITIRPMDCDIIITNNGSLKEFEDKVRRLRNILVNYAP